LVEGNAADLHLALGNIVDNAIRFTSSGGNIQIQTGRHAEGIFIAIVDSGVGIDADVLPHIFERFYRADQAHTTRGFGLGLPIAQRIIEGHGGRIEVESVVNEGTTVKVILPIKEDD
jgi:signal transduction histidine kinase